MSRAPTTKIRLKLFASLRQLVPTVPQGQVEFEALPGTTPATLFDQYAIPPAAVHLILVNGIYLPPEEAGTRLLRAGDVVALWPPVAGG